MKVAIQGGIASFHDIAARKYFTGHDALDTVKCQTFREVCKRVSNKDVDYGVLAIENSIAGSILNNYSLIQEYDLKIAGEVKLRIALDLMALPGQKIEDLEKIKSHYMALLQASDFLSQYPDIRLEETDDTADSARYIRENSEKGVGAVAGHSAAQRYELEVLAEEIETIKQNYTRFMILVHKDHYQPLKREKATLCFQVANEVGSLTDVLNAIVNYNLNMTKIQSVPLIGKPDEYAFYVDCEWYLYQDFVGCMEKIATMVNYLNILGEYKKPETVYDRPAGGTPE